MGTTVLLIPMLAEEVVEALLQIFLRPQLQLALQHGRVMGKCIIARFVKQSLAKHRLISTRQIYHNCIAGFDQILQRDHNLFAPLSRDVMAKWGDVMRICQN